MWVILRAVLLRFYFRVNSQRRTNMIAGRRTIYSDICVCLGTSLGANITIIPAVSPMSALIPGFSASDSVSLLIRSFVGSQSVLLYISVSVVLFMCVSVHYCDIHVSV